jgi:AraC family transcriptional regulator
MEAAVEHVIATMWDRYDEPLSLAELADMAILSRFYFSRVFRAITGTSPGRFLTAIRLYKAKNLLLETSLSVTEISYMVGYNSLGTFTSRFTKSVGISPARYRAMAQVGIEPPAQSRPGGAPQRIGSVFGSLRLPPSDLRTRIYIGSFESPIPQGMPISCDILEGDGPYLLDAVPDGEWYIQAAAVAMEGVDPRPWNRRPLFVGGSQPVRISSGLGVRVDIDMRPTRSTDLPILVALPELDSCRLPDLTGFGERRVERDLVRDHDGFELTELTAGRSGHR